MSEQIFLGVDVGSGCQRAVVIGASERRLVVFVRPINPFHHHSLLVERSSADRRA